MPELESLETRKQRVTAIGNGVRYYCVERLAYLAASNVPADDVVALAGVLQANLDTVAATVIDQYLVDYCATQYAGQAWTPIDQQVTGVSALVTQVIAQCKAVVPKDASGNLLTRQWSSDGKTNATLLTPADTADLRAALQAVVDAIPG